MLPCPYCRTPLVEDSPACPSCEFDLGRAKAVMGPIPRLEASGLSDFTGILPKHDHKRILKARNHFMRRFPKHTSISLVSRLRSDFPLPVTLFWLFNLGGFSSEEEKQGHNRDIFIAVDPHQSLVGITTGYGLEPFLSSAAMDRTLERTSPYFQTGDIATGVTQLLDLFSAQLVTLAQELPTSLGLEQKKLVPEVVTDF